MAEKRFYIIYPENRFVTSSQMKMWYYDAVANDEIAREYLDLDDTARMAEALSDAGIITLGQSIMGAR